MSDSALLTEVAAITERHADTVRRDAALLARSTGTCEWDGPAARRFRADAAPLLHQLGLVAGQLDEAADILRRHAR